MKTYEINGVHYYFDKNKFSKEIKRYLDKKKAENTPCFVKDIYTDLAEKCSTTWDNVKRWRMGNHGPGDLERIKIIADYFGIDYMSFLSEVKEKENDMDKENFDDMLLQMTAMSYEQSLTINFATVKFIKMLDELAEKSKGGYISFTKLAAIPERSDRDKIRDSKVVYDEKNSNRLVLDMLIDELHDDIISYYDDADYQKPNFKATVRIFDEFPIENEKVASIPCDPYIEILTANDECIIIDDGEWDFC